MIILADEIYDRMVYDDAVFIPIAPLVRNTVCLTYSGLSKVYRACGYRVGWCIISGDVERGVSLPTAWSCSRRCACAATFRDSGRCRRRSGRFSKHRRSRAPGGRLSTNRAKPSSTASRRAKFLTMVAPQGAMYAFIRSRTNVAAKLDDQAFSRRAARGQARPGRARQQFQHAVYDDHFRITTLPDRDTIQGRIQPHRDAVAAACRETALSRRRYRCAGSRATRMARSGIVDVSVTSLRVAKRSGSPFDGGSDIEPTARARAANRICRAAGRGRASRLVDTPDSLLA